MNTSMRRVTTLLLLVFAVAAHAATDQEIAARAGEYLATRTEMGAFSGAVLIVRDGKVLLRRGYGYADVEARKPFTPDTRFEVASISKMFTSMAALKLRDAGKLKLDDPLCKYIDSCPDAWQPITIQEVMRHTSGLPDYEEVLDLGSPKYLQFMTKPDSSRRIIEEAKKKPLDFAPGTKFNYSNTGYIALAFAIEKAAGEPFARYVRERILGPAGMSHSGVLGTGEAPKDLAFGYTHEDLGWKASLAGVPLADEHLQRRPMLALTPPAGDAWLYSTVDDLYRWSTIMDGSALVPRKEADEVFTAGIGNYGYGWFVDTSLGHRRYRHTGALPGYVSQLIKFPDDKITIVILSNLDRAPMMHTARNISMIALGQPYDPPVRGKVVTLDAAQIHALEGEFKMEDGTPLTIHNSPRFLEADMKGFFTAGLIPLSPTRFYMPLSDGVVTFTLDANGIAQKVNLHYSAQDHIATRAGSPAAE
jgi:CubicO group peptidase (beta-lactamase class C family)